MIFTKEPANVFYVLVYAQGIDGYKAERLPGSFQEVPKGAPLQGCFTIDEFGRRWQVQ